MNKIIKNFFILFSILVLITGCLIMIYYILPKNYVLHDKDLIKLNTNKKINLKPDEEYIIENPMVNIDLDIPLQIENWFKSETIINQPNMTIEPLFGSIIKIKNTTDKSMEFIFEYDEPDIV